MKKNVVTIFLVLCAVAVFGQTDKQPKLRITPGFLSDRFELGDKDVSRSDVQLHLNKTHEGASVLWKQSKSQGTTGSVFSLVGSAFLVGTLLAKSTEAKLGLAVGSVISYSFSIGFSISGNNKQQRAKDMYNLKYGY